MSSKQDKNYENKIAAVVAQGEKADDMEPVIKKSRIASIQFPNETWEEIIMWIKRLELGERVSLVNDRLFCISYPFMHEEKEHPLSEIVIFGGNSKPWMKINHGISNISKSGVPTVERSENIVSGNSNLFIREFDNDVLQFVRLLAPIYSFVNIYLNTQPEENLYVSDEMKELMRLFAGKIQGFAIGDKIPFSEFYKNYADLMKDFLIICIHSEMSEQEMDILKNWLFESRKDGKPKLAWKKFIFSRKFIETIKEDFMTSNKQSSFIISTNKKGNDGADLACNIVNTVTDERFTIQFIGVRVIIARLPQNCVGADSPLEMFNNTCTSLKRLSNVKIDLLHERSQPSVKRAKVDDISEDEEDLGNEPETMIIEEHVVALNPKNLERRWDKKKEEYMDSEANAVLWLGDFHTKCEFSVENDVDSYYFAVINTMLKREPNFTLQQTLYTWVDGEQKMLQSETFEEDATIDVSLSDSEDKHGIVVHPTCYMRARVLIKRTTEDKPTWPTFGDENDVKLVIDKENFIVNKFFLMSNSPEFCVMFTHKMAEKTSSKVEIKDTNPEEFRAFLEALSPKQIQPNYVNLLGVFKLADKYHVNWLKQRCAKWMAHAVEIPLVDRFITAEKYGLTGLNAFFMQKLIDKRLNKFFADNSDKLKAEGIDCRLVEQVAQFAKL